jgi:hypothetical protein
VDILRGLENIFNQQPLPIQHRVMQLHQNLVATLDDCR